ncbi:hypothetical protein KY289_000730 [Solanum tuberosum]|nr:hypothetical protein KY289_000730 [Solanum tuberosum]
MDRERGNVKESTSSMGEGVSTRGCRRDLEILDTPKNAAWVVRKIIDSREVLINSTSAARVLLQEMKRLNKQGKFQVKATYQYLQQKHPRVPRKSLTLHKHLHPRHRFHLRLVVQQRLSTVDRLQGIQIPMECAFSSQEDETFTYLFFSCSYSYQVWTRLLH